MNESGKGQADLYPLKTTWFMTPNLTPIFKPNRTKMAYKPILVMELVLYAIARVQVLVLAIAQGINVTSPCPSHRSRY